MKRVDRMDNWFLTFVFITTYGSANLWMRICQCHASLVECPKRHLYVAESWVLIWGTKYQTAIKNVQLTPPASHPTLFATLSLRNFNKGDTHNTTVVNVSLSIYLSILPMPTNKIKIKPSLSPCLPSLSSYLN